jgi:hypothetical protein
MKIHLYIYKTLLTYFMDEQVCVRIVFVYVCMSAMLFVRRRCSTAIIVHRARTRPRTIRKTSIGFTWHLLMRLVISFSDRYKLNYIRTTAADAVFILLARFPPRVSLSRGGYYPAKSQIHWLTTVIRFCLFSRPDRGTGEEERKKKYSLTVIKGNK